MRAVARAVDRSRVAMDFLIHTTRECAYDEDILAAGCRIIRCPNPSRPIQYARRFRQALAEYGPYDVVHSHVHQYSGYVLRLAHQAGVPVRIAHSHSNTVGKDSRASALRRVYLNLMTALLRRHATVGLAVSEPAAIALFGAAWEQDPRWRVLHCGIDLSPFRERPDPQAVRKELGLPTDGLVIGHVGSFTEPKNHPFLLSVMVEIARREPSARLLLVGDGVLRPQIEQRIREEGLRDRVVLAGLRSDVPRVLMGAIDVFAFPSLFEGLPLSLVEAQAAGIGCVMSDAIAGESVVVSELVTCLPLAAGPTEWASAVLDARNRPIGPEAALSRCEASDLNLLRGIEELERIYARRTA